MQWAVFPAIVQLWLPFDNGRSRNSEPLYKGSPPIYVNIFTDILRVGYVLFVCMARERASFLENEPSGCDDGTRGIPRVNLGKGGCSILY